MPLPILCLWLALVAAPDAAAGGFLGLDDFLERYAGAGEEERGELARTFVEWQRERGGFPVVEAGGRVAFVYVGDEAGEVRLRGDLRPRSFFNVSWDPAGLALERLGAVHYLRLEVEPDARLDYGFLVDGETVPDPLNPRRIVSGPGGGEVSELVMPEYRFDPALLERPGVPQGTLEVVEEPWAQPKVTIYLPPGYDSARRHRTLYAADGSAWLEHLGLPGILDNLIEAGRIEAVIAVLIDPAEDRAAWYYYDRAFLAYVERVVEHVDRRYATRPEPAARIHAGSSAGGRATLVLGLERPDLFRNLGMLSPAVYGPIHFWAPWLGGDKCPHPELRLWMSAGAYEGTIPEDVRALERHFRALGLEVATRFTPEGHSLGAWRAALPEMLEWLLAPEP